MDEGPQTIHMGYEETIKYFVCSVKGGRHCDKEPGSGNQRLEVRVSNDCPTNGKSFTHIINTILFYYQQHKS